MADKKIYRKHHKLAATEKSIVERYANIHSITYEASRLFLKKYFRAVLPKNFSDDIYKQGVLQFNDRLDAILSKCRR